jgi:putative FmdB family regulatory protein
MKIISEKDYKKYGIPKYEFECLECHETFGSFNQKEATCSYCQSENTKRIYNVPNIIFKGNGFYKNDNKKQSETKGS